MIRKQIYLTPVLDRELAIAARREGKSEAAVIREILEERLDVPKDRREPAGAVLLRMAQNAVKGPGDLSTNLFSYLYGEKSSKYGRGKRTTTLTKQEKNRLEQFLHERPTKTTR